MAMPKRIVVCGGNGFVGSRICRSAVARGWDVTSISRSGEPTWASVTSSPSPPPWAHKVTWERADILKPRTYAPLLKNTNYVVHSMGILLEADYKGVISGRESPISGLQRAFSAEGSSQNPLDRKSGEDLRPQEKDGQLTYELMNRDSAVTLAKEADNEGVEGLAYISAIAGALVLPSRYIETKREAESTISSECPGMRSVFIRAPFMYDQSRTLTMPLAVLTGLGAMFNSATGGKFGGLLGAGGIKPLKADLVAEAVVEALADENVNGPVEVQELEELAQKAWRKNML